MRQYQSKSIDLPAFAKLLCMPQHPQISAIICTHNRHTYLGAAIDSLLIQDFPDNFEVVVVDNASCDYASPESSTSRTREVVDARLGDRRLKYVWEPEIGLSVARNTGAKEARSEILAYLDDDAVAEPNWLRVLYSAYQSNQKLAVAGGKVNLLWPDGVSPPEWLSPALAQNLGVYDLGESCVYVTAAGLTPRGVNYSIRRTFLELAASMSNSVESAPNCCQMKSCGRQN